MPKPLDTSHINWKDYFMYDESSPTCLRWAVDIYDSRGVLTPHGRAGYAAGKKNGDRSTVLLSGKRYKVHRIVWEMHNGPVPAGLIVDHEDGDELNNRIGNLRATRQLFNTRNAKKRSDNASGVTGVSKQSNGRGTDYWVARWSDADGKTQGKRFNVKTLGDTIAFDAACSYRAVMVAELNNAGAGYTSRHGT